jgi:hypothetical protein
VASVRANQIAQQMAAMGELGPAALFGRSAKALTAQFNNVFCSSNLSIARLL